MLRVLEALKVKGSNANDKTEAHKILMVRFVSLSFHFFFFAENERSSENKPLCNKCDRKSLIGTKSC